MARLSAAQGLDGVAIRQLLSRRSGETPGVSSTEPRRAEGLPAHRRLGGMPIKGPGEARAVVRVKGLEDFSHNHTQLTHNSHSTHTVSRSNKKELLHGQPQEAADQASDEECTRPKPLRIRKTVQNRRIDLSVTDSDRRNRRRRPIIGEVSPRQRCHCSSILVSLRKDVGAVTAEHTGH